MKKVLFMLGVAGVLMSCQLNASEGSKVVMGTGTKPEYDLSYQLKEDGSFKVDVYITQEIGYGLKADKCYGTIDKVDGLTDKEILVSTLWEDCFSGENPSDVISNLLYHK
jgi:hypothetical protein